MPRCPSMQKSIGNRCISSEPLSIWAVFPCPRMVSKSASTIRCPLIDTSAPSEWEVGAPPERRREENRHLHKSGPRDNDRAWKI